MDFKNGDRKSSEPRKANTELMIAIAKGMTDDEMKAAADYFGSMKWTPWIKVVETKMVPKTRIQGTPVYSSCWMATTKSRWASALLKSR